MATRSPLTISSRSNSWFKRFARALEHHDEEIVIEGPKPIQDAISGGLVPSAIAAPAGSPENRTIEAGILFDPPLFRELTDTVNPQEILALFPRPIATLKEIFSERESIVVALDGVQDPGNVGTIVRLAAAFGAGGVVLTEDCADAFGPKAIRASAGGALAIPICRSDRTSLLEAAAESEFDLYAASASGTSTSDVPEKKAVLVFGSEGRGVSEAIAKQAKRLSIPMSSGVESLNVAAAAAIILFRSYEKRMNL